MPRLQILSDLFASDSAIIVRREIHLPAGARLKRVTIGDYTTACLLMSATLMKQTQPANTPAENIINLISRGAAESGEDLSWEGDLATDGMKIVAIYQTTTVADQLRTRALVEFP